MSHASYIHYIKKIFWVSFNITKKPPKHNNLREYSKFIQTGHVMNAKNLQ